MRVLGLLMALTLVLTGCGTDTGAKPDKMPTLRLSKGAKVRLPAPTRSGVVSEKTPVSVGFSQIQCAAVLPEMGLSHDYTDIVDIRATSGKKACLVELSVTNLGMQPNFFGSAEVARLRTDGGKAYRHTSQNYSNQAIAASRARFASDTADLIDPGRTKWDYVIYEVPVDAEPEALVYDAH